MAQKVKKVNPGFYRPEIIEKFAAALKTERAAIQTGEKIPAVSISGSNSKMGAVASVSLLPFITCPGRCADTCGRYCYAAKLANLRPNVRDSYARNTALLMEDPARYWEGVRYAAKGVKYFRFHVSGDIVNADYFAEMVKTARDIPGTEFLAFTKRYEIVNRWIDDNGAIPGNLHILFSDAPGNDMLNPHRLPETQVIFNESDMRDSWKYCGGNCFECACRGVGCWTVKNGETIAFKKH